MRIDNNRLNRLLAKRCMNLRDLRAVTSSNTLTRVRRGEDVLPATIGRIARALDVDPEEPIQKGA